MKIKNSIIKSLTIIALVLFLFSLTNVNASIDTSGEIYSMPIDISASLDENIVTVNAKPEIWNPGDGISTGPFDFLVKFNLTILNNSQSLTYETTNGQTLIGFIGIPSGISTQNTFTATYNFSSTLEEEFNGSNLFNATVEIYTTAPSNIEDNYDHIAISGSKVHIKNNITVIQQASPVNNWGEINRGVESVPWFGPISFLVLIGVGLARYKRKNP
ncbi:MAG: hypothetical protein ACW981_16010 [Candidatus Hodarchaeales archaeon]|jgi:hypothetical protein